MCQEVNIDSNVVMGQYMCIFFFFQAEDGIRDLTVTGVQTCALPISSARRARSSSRGARTRADVPATCAIPTASRSSCSRSRPAGRTGADEVGTMKVGRVQAFAVRYPEPNNEIGRASCRERV